MAQPSKPTVAKLELKGLYTNPSTFGSNVPPGAMTILNNLVIDRPSVIATRKGFANTYATLGATSLSEMQFSDTLITHANNNVLYRADAAGTLNAYTGAYMVPSSTTPGSRVRSVEANRNFYFITGNGTYRLDTVTSNPRLAGAPPGLSGTGVTAGSSGFLPNTTNVAYRVVFGYTDANNQLVLGAPSSRIVVANNTGGTRNVTLTFQLPKEVQNAPTTFIYKVYRSVPSANLATPPDDNLYEVKTGDCTATPTITFTDINPVTLVGAALYTNASNGEGITKANYRAPLALDITLFKQYTLFANTRSQHQSEIILNSAGASNSANALVPGNTITFTSTDFSGPSFVLTAAAANNYALGQFAVSNTGNPALDIQETARNIVLVANGYPSNTFIEAYYTSNDADLPGAMRFSRLDYSTVPFTFTSNNTLCWNQILPLTSSNNINVNRIYYSKPNQPDAVPLLQYIDVGSANQRIDRILPIRDGVVVMKQDGVFYVSNPPDFIVTGIDFNVRIYAPNTAAELDNKIYFLSNQGVVAATDNAVEIKSYGIDKTIQELTAPALFPNLQEVAFGVAYNKDRKYILFMPSTGADNQSTQQYVYNFINEVWSRWSLSATCGIVLRRDEKLYLGSATGSAPGVGNSYIYQERKNQLSSDYVDNQYNTSTVTTGTTSTIVIPNVTLPNGIIILPGWTIQQSTSGQNFQVITSTTGMTDTTLVLDTPSTWTPQNLILYTPIYTEMQTIQIDCSNPGMNKQFSEIEYIFQEQGFNEITATTTSDTTNVPAIDYLKANTVGGWGIDPWGLIPWGGGTVGAGKVRRYIPMKTQRAGWIYINLKNAEAFTSFSLSGLEMHFNMTSNRQK